MNPYHAVLKILIPTITPGKTEYVYVQAVEPSRLALEVCYLLSNSTNMTLFSSNCVHCLSSGLLHAYFIPLEC